MRLDYRDLGSFPGRCASCGCDAVLRLTESAVRRRSLLSPHDPQRARTATCSVCGRTYPVRADDATPAAAAGRRDGPRQIGSGRDWAYPEAV